MITSASKFRRRWIKESLSCFLNQSYSNREMIIVLDRPTEADRISLVKLIRNLGVQNIQLVDVKGKKALGELRNISISKANGEILCGWDDDDLYHKDRLRLQFQGMKRKNADVVYLKNNLHFFPRKGLLYLNNWQRKSKNMGHPGTLMFKKNKAPCYPTRGPASRKSEDIYVLDWFKQNCKVSYLDLPPFLYTYVCHGKNTWSEAHHMAVAQSLSEPRDYLVKNMKQIVSWVRSANLKRAKIIFSDSSGPFKVLTNKAKL